MPTPVDSVVSRADSVGCYLQTTWICELLKCIHDVHFIYLVNHMCGPSP